MTDRELAKQINENLYPEVTASGSLSNALARALAEIGSPLTASVTINFIPLARVAGGSRFCQMCIAAHERLFMSDFSNLGVTYGKALCRDLNEAARAIHFWIIETPDLAAMRQRFNFFTPSEQGLAHEAGNAVEHGWNGLLARWAKSEVANNMSPLRLIQAASQHAELRQLIPFTSLYSLHFSRTTGFPFTSDCPFASPTGDGRFRVYSPGGKVIGEGNVEQAIEMLISNLPPNCGRAVSGTAEDFRES